MKQQTAVEWLIQELRKPNSDVYIDGILEQAKQMEKEQIIEAAKINLWCAVGDGSDQAEQYYNETYSK